MEQKTTVTLKEFVEVKGNSRRTIFRHLNDPKFTKKYNPRQYEEE